MKFLTLKIKNLASLADATVDFTASPLKDADLFLVSGETGSGKSTILDAICLALYGTAPRFQNGEKGSKNDLPEGLTLTDPRRIMRKGAGECYSELKFEAKGKIYTAIWYAFRARKKPTGKFQNIQWTLTDENNHSEKGANAIEPLIKELVGLDYTQFSRTVMLSQGDFAAFLKSSSDEKATLLQKITGVSKYQVIGKRIFEHKREADLEAERCRSALEDKGKMALTDEQLAELRESQTSLSKKVEATDAEIKKLNAIIDWLRQESDFTKAVSEAEKSYSEKEAETKEESFVKEAELVDFATDYADEISLQRELNRLRNEKQEAERGLNALGGRLAGYSLEVGRMKTKKEKQESLLSELNEKLESERCNKEVYAQYESIIETIGKVEECRNEKSLIEADVSTARKNLAEKLTPALDLAKEKENGFAGEIEKKVAEIKAFEKTLEAMHTAELRKEKEQTASRLNDFKDCKKDIESVEEQQASISKLREDVEATCKKLEEARKENPGLEKKAAEARGAMEAAEKACRHAEQAAGEGAEQLRAHLEVGCDCPVCGQEVTQLPEVEEVFKSLLKTQKQLRQEARDAYDKAAKELIANTTFVKTLSLTLERDETRLKADEKANAEKAESVRVLCLNLSLSETTPEKLKAQIDEKVSELQSKLAEFTEQLAKGEQLEGNIAKARTEKDKLTKKKEKQAKEVEKQKEKVSAAEQNIASLAGEIKTLTSQITGLINSVRSKLEGSRAWQHNFESTTKEFSEELRRGAEDYNKLVTDHTHASETLDLLTSEIEKCESYIHDLLEEFPVWRDVELQVCEVNGKLSDALIKLVTAADSKHTALRQLNESILNHERRLKEFYDKMPEVRSELVEKISAMPESEVNRARTEVQEVRTTLATRLELLKVQRKQLDEHRAERPESLATDIEFSIEEQSGLLEELKTKRDGWLSDKAAIDEKLKQQKSIGDLVKDAKKALDEANRKVNRWRPLCEFLGDAEGKKFQRIALSYLLKSLVFKANRYMETLLSRYTLRVTPGTLVITVIDNYMGGLERTSNTISGGETFLVSLALALALGDISELNDCDTLFIDEGFGSLSGNSLAMATQTLRSLHSRLHRRVGIISHIAELRESVPVRMLVKKNGNTGVSTLCLDE